MSYCTRAAGTRSDYTGSFCAMDAGTKGACTKSAYTKNACIKGTCVEGASIKGVCAKNVCVRNAYIKIIGAVKRLGIYLQSSQILEVGQYGTRLKTGIEAG